MFVPLMRGLFLSLFCLLLTVSAFGSDGKNKNSLRIPEQAPRNGKPRFLHANFADRVKSVRVIGIASPRTTAVHYINNIPEQRYDWAEVEKRGALKMIRQRLADYSMQSRVLEPEGPLSEELEDVYALYAAIRYSIEAHTRKGKHFFYHKFATFDYSVGPIDAVLDKMHVDALLLTTVDGVIVSKSLSASRKGCETTAALIDRTGALLWYGKSDTGFYDIRKESDVSIAMSNGLRGFPSWEQ